LDIISISIDKDTLQRLSEIQRNLGFRSRSKMLRNAVLSLVKDYEGLDSLTGHVESVFVLTYSESQKNKVSDAVHQFEDTIKTELHQHHHSGTCVDIINLDTSAQKTREFYNSVKRNKSIYSVTYALVHEKK
jgi:CopG family transcriptional regulator, nickel-responsive regulator